MLSPLSPHLNAPVFSWELVSGVYRRLPLRGYVPRPRSHIYSCVVKIGFWCTFHVVQCPAFTPGFGVTKGSTFIALYYVGEGSEDNVRLSAVIRVS